MAGLLDFVLQPFKDWYGYIQVNYAKCYIQLLKIAIARIFAAAAVLFLFLLLGAGIFYAASTVGVKPDASNTVLLVILAAIYVIIALIATMWIERAFGYTAYLFIDAEFKKQPFGILDSFSKIKGKAFWLVLLDSAMRLALVIPGIVIFVLLIGGSLVLMGKSAGAGTAAMSGMIGFMAAFIGAYLFLLVYIFMAMLLYNFVVQFWAYNLLIDNLGLIAALKRSGGIVKARFLEVLVFGMLLWAGSVAFSFPLMIYGFAADIFFRVLDVVSSAVDPLVYFAVMAVFIVVNLLITAVLETVIQMFALPSHYLFWKQAKSGRTAEANNPTKTKEI